MKWLLWLWIFGIFIAGLPVYHLQSPFIIHPCPSATDYKNNHPNKEAYPDYCAAFPDLASRTWNDFCAWTVEFVHINKELIDVSAALIAAFSTIAIAVFTFTLWITTRRLWISGDRQIDIITVSANAAKKSADALPALERAYVFLEIGHTNINELLSQLPRFDENGIDITYGISGLSEGFEGMRRPRFSDLAASFQISFWFVNYGKTPAIIKDLSFSLTHQTIMNEPTYFEKMPILRDVVIPSGYRMTALNAIEPPSGEISPYVSTDRIPIRHAIAVEIANNRSSVWFYGRITYDDVFGVEHVTPWWMRYSPTYGSLGVWRVSGEPEYNKRT